MAELSSPAGEAHAADTRAGHLPEAEQRRLSHAVLTRQIALSIRVAVIFSAALLGLPLLNWLAPTAMQINVAGFPLTWLLLALLFYPLTWILSGYFIRESDNIEHRLTVENRADMEWGAMEKREEKS